MERFVQLHAESLSRRALWLTRNPTDAADLCQETWERALRGAQRRAGIQVTYGWLLTIMHNAFLDHRRAAVVRRTAANASATLEQRAHEVQEIQTWRTVDDALLRSCVEQLSTGTKGLIEMQLAGVPYSEIAARSGIRIGTVGTRLLRGRRRLRKLLAQPEVRGD
jgi:RNA polymerase sigma-70 factor (ECF subfamily)